MARVIWRPEALAQLDDIAAYIDRYNPNAATRTIDRLTRLGNSLQSSPLRGRRVASGHRQLAAVRPYVLLYEVEGDTVYIAHVRHGAREPLA